MKNPVTVLSRFCRMAGIAIAAGAVLPAAAQPSFVQENAEAFFAIGSDGASVRVHLINKTSGQVRSGLVGGSNGEITWEGTASSGVENITGAALWRTSAASSVDLLAVTAPAHNRIERPPAGASDAFGYNVTGVVGPAVLAGLDPASSAGTHFILGSMENGDPVPVKLSAYGILTDVTGSQAAPPLLRAANRVKLKTGAVSQGALVFDGRVQVAVVSGAGALTFPAGFAVPVPESVRWTYGWFKNDVVEPHSQFLEFTLGETAFRLRQVTEPLPGIFSFAGAVSFDLGAALEQLTVLQISGSPRLVAIFTDGSARLYDFNGVAAPVLRANYTNPSGDWRFGMAGGGGKLVLLTDTDWQVFNATGAAPSALPLASGTLPVLRTRAAAQNVFILQGEPFANPAATLAGGSQFDEWASDPATPDGQPRPLSAGVNLRTERLGGESSGLGLAAASRNVPAQGAGRFLLPNQHRADASVASFGTSAGNIRPDVSFAPAPGTYAPAAGQSGETGGDPAAAVTVRLASSNGAAIFYRPGISGAWLTYDTAHPLAVNATLTLEARTATSPIRRAVYTVVEQSLAVPAAVDTDLNGLSDGWEQLFGQTNPNSDPDGDGVNNLTEQNAGTDPLNPASHPGLTPLSQINLIADLSADGNTMTITWPADLGSVVLEHSTNYTDWAPVNPPPVGNRYVALINTMRGFFRLTSP